MSSQGTSLQPLTTPGNSAPAPNEVLLCLEQLIAQDAHQWGTKETQKKLEADILVPLRNKIRADKQDKNTRKGNIKVLRSLSSNPNHLVDFTRCILDGSYLMNPFQVISLSGVKTTTTFARLGIEILDNYPINKILKIAQSGSSSSFNKCHDYHFPIRTEHVIQLNDALEEKRECYFGESEHVSRVMIDTYFDALANHLPAIARLEFCLARITAKLEAIEVDRTDGATVHRTFLTGEVDYALLSIIHYEDGLPNCRLGNKRQRRNLLRELELKSFRGTYQGLAGYLLQAMKGNTPNLDWDILFIEAKRRSWFLPTGTVSPASLYQAIATCRAAQSCGRDGRRVLKLCLTSGDHWTFIVVNNDTLKAYVTQVLDNSDLARTEDVLLLKALWIIEEHIFGKISREAKAKASPSTDKAT